MVLAVAVDIDGTITHRDRSISCRAVKALRRLEVPVVLSTGNISCFARTAAKLIGVSDMVICENGGVVRFDYDGEDIVLGDKKKCLRAADKLAEYFDLEFLDEEYRKSEVCVRRTFPANRAREILKGMGVKLLDSGYAYHIVDENVSKGKALVYMAREIGIDVKDFAAIGDSENDVEMIEVAGIGIAVANADEKLKAAADVIVSGSDGEGVEQALKLLKLI